MQKIIVRITSADRKMKPRFLRHVLALSAGVIMLAMAPVQAQQQKFINVLTGGTSGVYYPVGVALSQIYGKALPKGLSGARHGHPDHSKLHHY